MGKVVKTVVSIAAAVAAVALAIPTGGTSLLAYSLGVSAVAATAIAAGLAIGSTLLAGRPKAPDVSENATDRLLTSINPRATRKMAMGSTALATDILDQEFTNDQAYLHRFVVVASHKIHAVNEIWFDDKLAWTLVGGVQGDFVGYLTVAPILEGSAGNAINISARMGSSRRYTGCAYVHFRFKLTGNSKKTESPFAQAIPTRVTIKGNGAYVYDPRLDSTAGGSGSCRANNQTTWIWNSNAARNPALLLLWYMLGWKISGFLVVGKGIPPDRIDMASFITAANLCDEAVTKAAGGTEPRYRADGIFGEGDSPTLVMDNLKAAMNADLDDVDGQIRVTVFHNDLATPIAAFTENDVMGALQWRPHTALDSSFNVVRGSYTDPSDASLFQLVEYPEVSLPSPDGIERVETFDLALVQSPGQAQRLAKQRLQRGQYGGALQGVWQATAWKGQKGDVITQSHASLGFVNKLFRIAEGTTQVDGTVPMILREEHEDIYAWDAEEAPAVAAADPTVYDFSKNVLIEGIDESAATANWDEVYGDGKPEDYATSADNMVINGSLADNAAHWDTAGGVFLYAVPPGDKVPFALVFPIAGAGTEAYANDNSLIPLSGAPAFFVSGYSGRDGTATELGIYVAWYQADGSVSAILSDETRSILPPVALSFEPFNVKFTPPADAVAFKISPFGNGNATQTYIGGIRVAKTEPAADVTFLIEGPASATLARDYGGAVKAGVLPKTFVYKMVRAGLDVTGAATFSATALTGSATFSWTGSALEITDCSPAARIEVTGTYTGTARKIILEIGEIRDPPPAAGSGGTSGTVDYTSAISPSTANTYGTANARVLVAKAGATGVVDLTFPGQYYKTSNGVIYCNGKVRWRVVGGVFADLGSEEVSPSSAIRNGAPDYENTPGWLAISRQKTGLTPGTDYEFDLLLRKVGSVIGDAEWVGTFTAAGA
ncbi:phage tail protein [Sphingobium boeckii]|uniref:Tip attachment protein J domain-containing protein n=1 Tax=Sphingobium boeckii TaxID=1082345 RepID=A0A7W9AES6_9SPHN|nr:phage tail protein [Sphingobium boeckii]MBB5684285.1 hypothetical protein [Sphingobium boeckii]